MSEVLIGASEGVRYAYAAQERLNQGYVVSCIGVNSHMYKN